MKMNVVFKPFITAYNKNIIYWNIHVFIFEVQGNLIHVSVHEEYDERD